MEQKIRGVEHELALTTRPQLPQRSLVHLVGMAINELRKIGLVTSIRVEEPRLDYMALNGFRVYDDMSHLELSSPSYNSTLESIIYDKVTELFTYYSMKGLKEYFKGVDAYKNNVSNTSNDHGWRAVSYSTHHSIIMNRESCNLDVWNHLEEALTPYMVTRILLTGGGDYVPYIKGKGLPRPGKVMKGDSLKFVISPRATFVKRLSSNDTVDARGLFNQRDDPHADPSKYWRFHDINFEGLRNPFQVYLRDCFEVLIMTAYEKGYYKNPPHLADPLKDIRSLTLDSEECNWKIKLENGQKVDAIAEILEGFYIAGIEEMLTQGNPTKEDKMSFNLIKMTLEILGERRLEYFIDGLDWITKKALIEEYADGNAEKGISICNQYNLIDEAVLEYIGFEPRDTQTTFSVHDSLEFAMDAIPLVNWKTLTIEINKALRNGPEGTRDYIRCLIAREFPGLVEAIEWERIKFHNAIIRLEEPFKFNKYTSGDILEKSTRTFMEFTQALDKLNKEGGHLIWNPTEDHEKEGV
jgi:proteasome accessory factor A